MHLAVEGLGDLGIDLIAESGQAAERGLDVAAGAAEAVVEVKVAEGGIEVVAPHQADDTSTEPDAFGIAGRAIDGLSRLGEFVGLALVFLGGIRGRGRLALLVVGVVVAALGQGTARGEQKESNGNSKLPQKPEVGLKHPPTHKFPDILKATDRPTAFDRLMTVKWVPNAANTVSGI